MKRTCTTTLILLPLSALLAGTGMTIEHGPRTSGASATEKPPVESSSEPLWPGYASPAALVLSPDGNRLFVACATANRIAIFDTVKDRVTGCIEVPLAPLGVALSGDGSLLYVACGGPRSALAVIQVDAQRVIDLIPVGHTAMAPVAAPDAKTVYVCNRFDNDVAIIDLPGSRVSKRIAVGREPVAAALTPDGKHLLIANHLQAGVANSLHVSATISVIDTATQSVIKDIPLGLGASMLNGLAISPDGRFGAVTHLRSMHWLSTHSVSLGRMNCNAVTLLDLKRWRVLGVLLLDQTGRGAANPWAVVWTPDAKTLVVSHAGTHELSLIDAPVDTDPGNFFSLTIGAYANDGTSPATCPRHPVRVRRRLELPGLGPRALACTGTLLYVANYFSDSLCRLDLTDPDPEPELLPVAPFREPSLARRGEIFFNDARLCSESWQSCASCHDTDARTDGLNWDLLNDGVGNPKNTRSLLLTHQRGPAMALGVRANAGEAVRAGIHHILFSAHPEEVPAAIEEWLKSLEPIPSPKLKEGRLTAAAERGKKLFESPRTGCVECHPPPLFTDLVGYNAGTGSPYRGMWDVAPGKDHSDRFLTPTLIELWRTAPYLHDGSAATMRDVLTTRNPNDEHGRTSKLSPAEIGELAEYLLSL